MRKRLLTLICLIIALVCSLGVLTGCDLVTTNLERDLNQVVAEVNIGGDYKGETEKIYKKDMILSYMNYGYSYAQQGSYSSSQIFEAIIDNLINDRIIVQTAKTAIKKVDSSITLTNWKAEEFLTEDEIADAKYNAIKNIDYLIKQYIETETTYQEAFDGETRAVPTGAVNKTEELETAEKQAYINSVLVSNVEDFKGEIGSKRRIAYNKTLKLLSANGLLGDNYKTGDIFSSYYYESVLESFYENKIKIKFEQLLINNGVDIDNNLSTNFNNLKDNYSVLEDAYTDMYNDQKKKYENDIDAYKTALSSQTKNAPIVYASAEYMEKFGYVYNLLIGATEEQTEKIGKIDKKNKLSTDIIAERENILKDDIELKDLRSSWVYSGYDAEFTPDEVGGDVGKLKFINDYKFTDSGYQFQGTVKWLNKVIDEKTYTQHKINGVIKYSTDGGTTFDEDYVPEFAVISLDKETGIDDILSLITNFVYGSAQDKDYNIGTDTDVKDKVNELIFAYSTDPGSLNSFRGYLIQIGDKKSSYVKEFQADGEKVLGYSNGSLIVCATDYGYHFMFKAGMIEDYQTLDNYMSSVDKLGSYADWEAYFNYLMDNWADLKDEDTDTYLCFFASKYMDTILNNYANDIQNVVNKDTNKVVKYESRYADLIGE